MLAIFLQVSRAHILNKATEYIRQMQKASAQRSEDIDSLKKKNELLEEQGTGGSKEEKGGKEGLHSRFDLVVFDVAGHVALSSGGFGAGEETREFGKPGGFAGFGGC